MKTIAIILILIPELTSAQRNDVVDSLLLNKISFNEDSARNDIRKGNIRLLDLSSTYTLEDSPMTNDDIKFVESKYGFKFYYEQYDIFKYYLDIKEKRYNEIVFKHLDSICHCNSEKSIYSDLKSRYFERRRKSP